MNNSPNSSTSYYQRAATDIIISSIKVIPNYSNCFLIFALGTLAGHLSDNPETNSDNVAAVPLITTFLNLCLVLSFAGFYPLSINLSKLKEQRELLLEQLNNVDLETGNETQLKEELTAIDLTISKSLRNMYLVNAPYLPFPIVALYYSEYLLVHVFSQNPHIAKIAASCLQPSSLLILCMYIRMGLEQALFSFKKEGVVGACALICLFISGALTYSLGYPLHLGILGFSLGLIVDSGFLSTLLAVYTHRSADLKDFKFLQYHEFTTADRNNMYQDFLTGLPIVLTLL